MNWKDLSPDKKIVLAFKENSQVSEFLINGLSRQNRSIRFGKPDCPVLDPGHVRPSSPDSSKDYRTYPAILPDMSGLPSKNLSFMQNLRKLVDLFKYT